MKYLVTIVCIFIAVTAITIFALWPEKTPIPTDTLVIINGQPLTRTALQEGPSKETHHGNDSDFINEAITQQLLIAEAQKRGIDKETEFRTDLKNYYEHSLIKVLMERVEKGLHAEVSKEEIEHYLQSFNKTYTFYTLKTSKDVTAEEIQAQGSRYSQPFEDLSSSMQRALAIIHPGDTTAISLTSNERMAIYLEKIDGNDTPAQAVDRSLIEKELLQAKVESQINIWIENLRRNATITYTSTKE